MIDDIMQVFWEIVPIIKGSKREGVELLDGAGHFQTAEGDEVGRTSVMSRMDWHRRVERLGSGKTYRVL